MNDVDYFMSADCRPPRRMPSTSAIAEFWRGDRNQRHHCWRCGWGCRPERAHIIDRCFGGLDGPQNLWLLCPECHDKQPSFRPGDEWHASAWIQSDDDLLRSAVIQIRMLRTCIECGHSDLNDAWHDWTREDFDLWQSGSAAHERDNLLSSCAALSLRFSNDMRRLWVES